MAEDRFALPRIRTASSVKRATCWRGSDDDEGDESAHHWSMPEQSDSIVTLTSQDLADAQHGNLPDRTVFGCD